MTAAQRLSNTDADNWLLIRAHIGTDQTRARDALASLRSGEPARDDTLTWLKSIAGGRGDRLDVTWAGEILRRVQ